MGEGKEVGIREQRQIRIPIPLLPPSSPTQPCIPSFPATWTGFASPLARAPRCGRSVSTGASSGSSSRSRVHPRAHVAVLAGGRRTGLSGDQSRHDPESDERDEGRGPHYAAAQRPWRNMASLFVTVAMCSSICTWRSRRDSKRKGPTRRNRVGPLGARGRNRTNDTGIFSPLLYRLSYPGAVA